MKIKTNTDLDKAKLAMGKAVPWLKLLRDEVRNDLSGMASPKVQKQLNDLIKDLEMAKKAL